MAKKFSPKDDEEVYTLGFDYTELLQTSETISSATTDIELVSGVTDPDMATMLLGSNTVNGAVVSQMVCHGVAGNVYRIDCLASTSLGNKYMLNGTLAITQKNPPSPTEAPA